MNTARLKAWIGYTLAVEEVERRLGLSWGAAQKALLEACERGELRWRNTPGGGPDIGDPDLFDWLEAKRSHPPSFKQSRILKLLAGMFSNHRVPAPELCPRKTLRADLLKLDPLLKPLDEATLKSAIDKYGLGIRLRSKRSSGDLVLVGALHGRHCLRHASGVNCVVGIRKAAAP